MFKDPDLIRSNQEALAETATLITLVGRDGFVASVAPAFASTVGAHVRHVIEHYQCFFSQCQNGIICYDKRMRLTQIEEDSDIALSTIKKELEPQLVAQLLGIDEPADSQKLYLCDAQSEQKIATTFERELAFLHSHTTHHNAMIAAMARILGFQPEQSIGVAIATQQYMESSKCAQ